MCLQASDWQWSGQQWDMSFSDTVLDTAVIGCDCESLGVNSSLSICRTVMFMWMCLFTDDDSSSSSSSSSDDEKKEDSSDDEKRKIKSEPATPKPKAKQTQPLRRLSAGSGTKKKKSSTCVVL